MKQLLFSLILLLLLGCSDNAVSPVIEEEVPEVPISKYIQTKVSGSSVGLRKLADNIDTDPDTIVVAGTMSTTMEITNLSDKDIQIKSITLSNPLFTFEGGTWHYIDPNRPLTLDAHNSNQNVLHITHRNIDGVVWGGAIVYHSFEQLIETSNSLLVLDSVLLITYTFTVVDENEQTQEIVETDTIILIPQYSIYNFNTNITSTNFDMDDETYYVYKTCVAYQISNNGLDIEGSDSPSNDTAGRLELTDEEEILEQWQKIMQVKHSNLYETPVLYNRDVSLTCEP